MNPYDSAKLSSKLQVKGLCYAFQPPNILLACVLFLSARGSSQQNVADCGSVCVCVSSGFPGWTGDIDQIIPTNKTYCFVMVWRMRLIFHPQSTLMNYWLVVSDVEPPSS